MMDERHFAPACERNREPILTVLKTLDLRQKTILEIASGSGEHGLFFSQNLDDVHWQPSDIGAQQIASIAAWQQHDPSTNYLPPISLDVTEYPWQLPKTPPNYPLGAIFSANMIHIAPWAATEGLFRGAGALLPIGAPLILYGPYKIDGQHTAPSNETFESSYLKAQNPAWGIRDIVDLKVEGLKNHLSFKEKIAMPANNFILIFLRD